MLGAECSPVTSGGCAVPPGFVYSLVLMCKYGIFLHRFIIGFDTSDMRGVTESCHISLSRSQHVGF